MQSIIYKYLGVVMLTYTGICSAEPFDKTGLIDLKNEATKLGSCSVVGSKLTLATTSIYLQIMERPAQGQDGQWKNRKEANEIKDFGQNANYWAKKLINDASKDIPPSQAGDLGTYYIPASIRFEKAIRMDPWVGVYAWSYCGREYGFLR